MIIITDKSKCSGCTACVNVCPRQCISMEADEEGYLYPFVDKSKCIDCGLCDATCPIQKPLDLREYSTRAFAVQHLNSNILESSASGGAFTAIAESVIDRGGVVWGGAYDDSFNVVHKCVSTKDELVLLRSSKYVQSDVSLVFKLVKKQLSDGLLVCFSGTPCLVNGLKSYLRKDYENLILVDLVCHGIPSPKLWKKFIAFNSTHNGAKLTSVEFRNKHYGYAGSTMALKYDDGTEFYSSRWVQFFKHTFFADLNTRPSCFACHFKTIKRVSDFTLYDCWHVGDYDKSMDDDRGATMILVHSIKALKIFETFKKNVKWCEVDVNDTIQKDGIFAIKCTEPNPKREQFFYDCNNLDIPELIDIYFPLTLKKRIVIIFKPLFSKLGLIKILKR